jgi:hypothetical protein
MQFKVSAHVRRVFGLVLVAGFVALTLSLSPGVASADGGGDHHNRHHEADVTFTKWVTNPTAFPWDMAGVVGGDVGDGSYVGHLLSLDPTDPNLWKLHALYEFHGDEHSFIADVQVRQNNLTGTAVITGVVTKGWLKGARVTGEYTVLDPCAIATPGNAFGTLCFQGTLHLERDSGD